MEHALRAVADGQVRELLFAAGETVNEGDLLLILEHTVYIPRGPEPQNIHEKTFAAVLPGPPAPLRADLQRVINRHASTLDAKRPEAMARRHAMGQRSAAARHYLSFFQGRVADFSAPPAAALRKELEAEPEGPQREALYQQLLARQYANGGAVNMATTLEIDAVIDPAQTREWLVRGLQSVKLADPATSIANRFIDAW